MIYILKTKMKRKLRSRKR